jgi:hypothetical protein
MSITLTTPVAFTIAGVTETDTIGVATSCLYDFQGMALTVTYKIGTALTGSPLSLNQGPAALANGYVLTVIFNLNTGVWSYTYSTQSGGGTLTGATLTTQQTNAISLRNEIEAFVAVAGGLLPGTIVTWTQL